MGGRQFSLKALQRDLARRLAPMPGPAMPTLKKWSASGVITSLELRVAAESIESAIRDGRLQVRGPRRVDGWANQAGEVRPLLMRHKSSKSGNSDIGDLGDKSHMPDMDDIAAMRDTATALQTTGVRHARGMSDIEDLSDMPHKRQYSVLSCQREQSHMSNNLDNRDLSPVSSNCDMSPISPRSHQSLVDCDSQSGQDGASPAHMLREWQSEWQKAVARILANSEALVERMAHIESGLQDVKAAAHKEEPVSHADDRLLQAIKHLDDTRRHLLTQWDAYRQTLIREVHKPPESSASGQGPDYLEWQRMQSRLARIEQRIEQLIEGMSR